MVDSRVIAVMVFEILVALLVLGCAYLYKRFTKNYGVLEKMGIPVVPPFLCFGSGPWAVHKIDFGQFDMMEASKFSKTKIWGRYV